VKRIRKVKVISDPLILLHILSISQLNGINKPVFPGYLNFKFCNRYILVSYNKYSVFNFAMFCYFRIGKEFAKYCTECVLLSDTAICAALSNSCVCVWNCIKVSMQMC